MPAPVVAAAVRGAARAAARSAKKAAVNAAQKHTESKVNDDFAELYLIAGIVDFFFMIGIMSIIAFVLNFYVNYRLFVLKFSSGHGNSMDQLMEIIFWWMIVPVLRLLVSIVLPIPAPITIAKVLHAHQQSRAR